MEELSLRCNNTNCRKKLTNSSFVTACSHIFCTGCANRAFTSQLVCPVCQNVLSGKYDIQQMDLAPSETYKSQVLSGLAPDIVQDICFRSISMYMYQVAQEVKLQELMYKHAIQKYKSEKVKVQKVEHKYSVEMEELMRKVKILESQKENDKRTISELQQQLVQKTRICQKLQQMYDINKQTPQRHSEQMESQLPTRSTISHKRNSFKFNSFPSKFSNNSMDNISLASTAKSPIDILQTPRQYSPSRIMYLCRYLVAV